MAKLEGPVRSLIVRREPAGERGGSGELQVCLHDADGKPVEEWRKPTLVEIAALMPDFVKDATVSTLETLPLLERMTVAMERAFAAETEVRRDGSAWAGGEPKGGIFGPHDGSPLVASTMQDGFDAEEWRQRDLRAAAMPRATRVGAQWIPFLREGGFVVSQGDVEQLQGEKQLLRFNVNTSLPEVGIFLFGLLKGEWRKPTAAEAARFSSPTCEITPDTRVELLIALFKQEGEDVRLVGFTAADEVSDVSGFRERIEMGIFDTLCDERHPLATLDALPNATNGGSGGAAQYSLFGGVNVGKPYLTSMYQAGSFASDQTAVMKTIEIEVKLAPGFIGESRKAALATVRMGTKIELVVGAKPFSPVSATPLENVESNDNGVKYEYPIGGERGIQVPARQNFWVNVFMSGEAREILSIPGTRARVWIRGKLTRDLQ